MNGSLSFWDFLAQGGSWAWMVLALAIIVNILAMATPVAAGVLMVKQRAPKMVVAMAVAMVGFVVLLLLLGGLGYMSGMSNVEAALAHASPESVSLLRAEGERLAVIPMHVAVPGAALPFLASLICGAMALKMRFSSSPS